jgi:hypothetical protein
MNGSNHTVEINATDYPYTAETITVDEVRRLGDIPSDHKVYIEVPEPTDDPLFREGETIQVHQLRKFYSVSPSITGGVGGLA